MTRLDNFAVLLNPNARLVSGQVLGRIHELVDPEHVFVSRDQDEAHAFSERILERGYDTVFTGGGDGTVTNFINLLPGARASADDADPRIGILRLGTGNAMAEIVSSGDPLIDLRSYVANPSSDSVRLGLCEADGVRFAFAGVGLDAAILNDYRMLQDRLRGPVQRALKNVGGYLAATFGVTVPRIIARWARGLQPRVRITNVGDHAYSIVRQPGMAEVGREYASGEVLYDGPLGASMFGTCPYYGYRMKALPYAGLDPSFFHLRVSNVPTHRLIFGLRRLWKGTLEHPGLHDFHAQRVKLEFSEPVPYQLAGEAMGFREELTVGMADRPVDLVRFI